MLYLHEQSEMQKSCNLNKMSLYQGTIKQKLFEDDRHKNITTKIMINF